MFKLHWLVHVKVAFWTFHQPCPDCIILLFSLIFSLQIFVVVVVVVTTAAVLIFPPSSLRVGSWNMIVVLPHIFSLCVQCNRFGHSWETKTAKKFVNKHLGHIPESTAWSIAHRGVRRGGGGESLVLPKKTSLSQHARVHGKVRVHHTAPQGGKKTEKNKNVYMAA